MEPHVSLRGGGVPWPNVTTPSSRPSSDECTEHRVGTRSAGLPQQSCATYACCMPKHREGHAQLVSVHFGAGQGGAHLPPEQPARRGGWLITVLVVGLTAVVAVTLLAILAMPRSPDPTNDQSSQPPPDPQEQPSASAIELKSVAQCRTAWNAVQEVLEAAQPSMQQWEVHIVAMNKLVAGKITLAQASAFWEQTRVDARRRYDAFASSDRRFDGRLCAVAEDSRPGAETLTSCARAVAAADSTRDAARTTLARWSGHITAMNRMRNGTLSPTMAQHMWLSTWRAGAAELRVYHQRERASDAQECPA